MPHIKRQEEHSSSTSPLKGEMDLEVPGVFRPMLCLTASKIIRKLQPDARSQYKPKELQTFQIELAEAKDAGEVDGTVMSPGHSWQPEDEHK